MSYILYDPRTLFKISNSIDVFLYVVFTVYIVISCDGVEKSCKKISTTCYLLLEGVQASSLRSELLFLGRYTTELRPDFTAGDFYKVNRSILAALFSSVTTYLIICIQFNM
ncbi:hypothetical protein NQ317_010156, partial [Molorchus minor]